MNGILNIEGLIELPGIISGDSRGSFVKLYSQDFYRARDLDFKIAQVNLSITDEPGTIRGLHFQTSPYSERKIVRCLKGRVFDVIVDLRRNSSTFMKFQTFDLNGNQKNALYVPPGCAHGFQVLEGPAEILYVHSEEYRPDFESGINALDPRIKISWPHQITLISDRDNSFRFLEDSFEGLKL